MTKNKKFTSVRRLNTLITQYFNYIKGKKQAVPNAIAAKTKTTKQLIWAREPEPPTLSGLALYLGFDSRQQFETYEAKPRYGAPLRRARLRIESVYEKKLHFHSSSGAVFALKNLGWKDKAAEKVPETDNNNPSKVEIIHSGNVPAAYEKEVIL
jgi:DNA-packaging protein gp3